MGRFLVVLSAALLVAMPMRSASLALAGHELHCVGAHAHLLHYDVEGVPGPEQKLADMQRAVISLEPSPNDDTRCEVNGVPAGDKRSCIGANQNSDCTGAVSDLPFKGGLECKGCFLGATADLYYKLNYSYLTLNSVEVGLRDMHVRAAGALDFERVASGTPISGSREIGDGRNITLINQLVACPLCLRVKISIGAPSSVDYALHLDGSFQGAAGAEFDVALGDQAIRWDKLHGWSHVHNKSSVTVKPILNVKSSGNADLNMKLKSSLLLNVDDIVWYRVDMSPSSDLRAAAHGSESQLEDKVCLDGDETYSVAHESDLHWSFLAFKEFHHWGPFQDYQWSKKGAIHDCKSIPSAASVEVLV